MPPERPGNSESDAELVARAVEGDVEAFGRLYDRYLEPLYRYVYYRVADHHEAEDLTETVFLNAWQALPRLEPRGLNLRAWLYRIAHNIVVDHHRRRRPSVSLEAVAPVPDEAQVPEAGLQAREETRELAEAIARLKPHLQEVLACRFLSGMSHAETAEVMGLSEGHVRVLQHRALRQVRLLLTGQGDRDG